MQDQPGARGMCYDKYGSHCIAIDCTVPTKTDARCAKETGAEAPADAVLGDQHAATGVKAGRLSSTLDSPSKKVCRKHSTRSVTVQSGLLSSPLQQGEEAPPSASVSKAAAAIMQFNNPVARYTPDMSSSTPLSEKLIIPGQCGLRLTVTFQTALCSRVLYIHRPMVWCLVWC